jgi:glycosyltransferase involved in cell wall biosynthesis
LAVGAGPEAESLRVHASALGVADRVHLPGRVEHLELPAVLSQADIYVQPSIGEESFGISVVEAMACRLPVLASDIGALREVVADGETGRLVAPGDIRAWTSALADLLADPARRQHMGAAARARAEAKFTWAANAEKLEAIFSGGAACAAS